MRDVGLDVHDNARELREADRVVEEVERLAGTRGDALAVGPQRGGGDRVFGKGVVIIIMVAFIGAEYLESRPGAEDVVDVVGGEFDPNIPGGRGGVAVGWVEG